MTYLKPHKIIEDILKDRGPIREWESKTFNENSRLEAIDKFIPECFYVCPICKATRTTRESNPEPCRLCGHKLIPFTDILCRDILRKAMEEVPIPTGFMEDHVKAAIRGRSE